MGILESVIGDLLYENQDNHQEEEMMGLKLLTSSLDQIGDSEVLLNKREKTHGIYRDNANLSQSIKDVLRSGKNWEALTDGQKEALEMISVKLSRLLTGDPNFRDHWDDIVGYAQLGTQSVPMNMPTVTADLKEAMGQ